MSENILLQMKDICKSFPGVRALDNACLSLKSGSVLALMGENGAGKSTLMKCLFGIYEKDSGTILLNGNPVTFKNPKEALEHGVAMVHQELNQALKRNVMDNIWLGRYPKSLGIFTSEKKMYEQTLEIFEKLNLEIDPKCEMSKMSVAQRQMVEIAKAVSYDAQVIVLDEPTSSLTEKEVEKLFEIIGMLKAQGCGIIYISHKMEEILRISDDITIMRDGSHVISAPSSEFDMDKIIRYMVGRELNSRFPEKNNVPGKIMLDVRNLSSRYTQVKDVSFNVRLGEIVGFAGLAGAGRSEMVENIFGISERSSGEIYLDGKKVENRTSAEAIRNGFALLTEERRATGIFGILDICENTTIANLKNYRRAFAISDKKRKKDTEWAIKSMNIKTPSQATKIRNLSGGNQQKVIIGRWLLTEPEVLMLDEPTRGIDVGAKYEIYRIIVELAKRGKAVIMVSSELPELMGVCDRIYVMSGGRMVGEVQANQTSQEQIMEMATRFA